MDEALADALRGSLAADTPPAADARIRAAIRRSRRRGRGIWWAAAAGIALALACGAWLYGHERHSAQLATMREDDDIILDIFCMASVDDVYDISTAQL